MNQVSQLPIRTVSKPTDGKIFKATKIPGSLNIATFGDVHLGHERTKTPEIIRKLYKLFPNNEETANLDFIFIEGDLFDRLLYLNNEYIPDIVLWMEWLIAKCIKYNIALRVLEGTPSHDMRQPEMMASLASKYSDELDFLYANKLQIEIHSKTGLSILYLPDEWNTPERSLEEARELIHSHGLTQVDVVCMHGSFEHQLPPGLGIVTHDRRSWEALVRYCIMVGHVHFYSWVGLVLAAGSFDRLRHGEEGPKGHLRITLTNKDFTAKFIENTEAKIYTTIDCSGLEFESMLERVEAIVTASPKDSYFRVSGKRSEGIMSVRKFLADKYYDMNWSDPLIEEDVEDKPTIDVLKETYVPINITKDNLEKLLMERLSKSVDNETALRCEALLRGAL